MTPAAPATVGKVAAWKPQVYLVGAGPGDAGLLTRRGEEALRRAEIILFDYLTNPDVLEFAPAAAERVYVGKKPGGPRPTQEWITEQLILHAQSGKTVVRLKGGDPFVFGRGGEEAAELHRHGIRFEVIPGVTSAVAVPAMAGIPVTTRGLNSVLHVIVGHEDPHDPATPVPWDALAREGNTLVVLMATRHIIPILRKLVALGLPDGTPVASVHWGSYPRQRSVRGTVGGAIADPGAFHLPNPAVTVIGKVAGLDAELNWFERRPLFARRIILTRPVEDGGRIAWELREAGADVTNLPAMKLEPVAAEAEASATIGGELESLRGGWLVLPSPGAIRFFFAALESAGLDARALHGVRVAVVGPGSARVLEETARLKADFIGGGSGAALARELPLETSGAAAAKSGGANVLIAGSARSRPELREGLAARGCRVRHLALYEPRACAENLKALAERLTEDDGGTGGTAGTDAVVLFSPSAAEAVAADLASRDPSGATLRRPVWYAIGETTASAMRDAGFEVAGTAPLPTADALIEVLSCRR